VRKKVASESNIDVIRKKQQALRATLAAQRRLLVAYSGGVDSAYLLAEATSVLGRFAVGVIADSPSLPRKALSTALEVAAGFGAEVRVMHTEELENPEYTSNPLNRCYFCKHELFKRLERLARVESFQTIAYGENADDALEFRAGAKAATEFHVISPLRAAGLTKLEIRQLSRERGLPTADEPAQPCLSSRIPHGTPVTREALSMIEMGEEVLRSRGFKVLRVRYMAGASGIINAKVQVDPKELERLYSHTPELESEFNKIGFTAMTIDPDGYRAPARNNSLRKASARPGDR
jgi:uncharacterized protein